MIVIPVYNLILAPEATVYMGMDQVRRSAGNKSITAGERVVMIVAKENQSISDMTEDSFYPIGISASITEVNNKGFIIMRTGYRVNIENIEIRPDNTISLSITRRSDIEDLPADVDNKKLEALKQEMREFAAGFEWAVG